MSCPTGGLQAGPQGTFASCWQPCVMSLCCGTCLGSFWRWTNCSFQKYTNSCFASFFFLNGLVGSRQYTRSVLFCAGISQCWVHGSALIYKELFENCKNSSKLIFFFWEEGLLFLFPCFPFLSPLCIPVPAPLFPCGTMVTYMTHCWQKWPV